MILDFDVQSLGGIAMKSWETGNDLSAGLRPGEVNSRRVFMDRPILKFNMPAKGLTMPRFWIKTVLSIAMSLVVNGQYSFADEPSTVSADDPIQRSVVKIFAKRRAITLQAPWRKQSGEESSGSGVIIGPGKVLTNAHVVMTSAEITIQPTASSDRIAAKVSHLAPGIDLALLEFNPEGTPLADVPSLEILMESPPVRSKVRVYGYPAGGESQAVTEGIVSRIEHTQYRYSAQGYRLQVDAAVNPGNSGGPAIVDGKVAGLAFSMRPGANSIGYVIPVEEIRVFQEDVADGKYDGKPTLTINYQYLENSALRRKLGIPAGLTGALIVGEMSSPDLPIHSGDVVTKVVDYVVDNRGNCKLPNSVNVGFSKLAVELEKSGSVQMTVWRAGAEEVITVPLSRTPKRVKYLAGEFPRYVIFGPIVLSEAAADYLDALETGAVTAEPVTRFSYLAVHSQMRAAQSPLLERWKVQTTGDDTELVVMPTLLPHETSRGYRPVSFPMTVRSINGVEVRNLPHATELLTKSDAEFIEMTFFDRGSETIVIDRKAALDSTPAIMEEHEILRQASADLLPLLGSP